MFVCPTCAVPLERTVVPHGVFWRCPACDGRSATLSQLRREIPAGPINSLWQAARSGRFPRQRRCPACGQAMAEVPAAGGRAAPVLDVCTTCQFVWFDYGEYKALPEMSREAAWEDSLPQAAREKLALLEVEAIEQRAREADGAEDAPDHWWHWIPGVLGLPVEENTVPLQTRPWMTWGVAALIVLSSLVAFGDLNKAVDTLGLVPAHALRYGGITLLTSFFIHGGVLHLAGNLYFLLIFGDNVEDVLGHRRFVLLLIGAELAGTLAHILGSMGSLTPCIGASGGISGIMAYYALRFPQVRLGLMVRFYAWFRWVRLPACALFLIWLFTQYLGAQAQLAGFSDVSSLAHLGGMAVGALVWAIDRCRTGGGRRLVSVDSQQSAIIRNQSPPRMTGHC